MQEINLGYGKQQIPFTFDDNFIPILSNKEQKFLSDFEKSEVFDNPIDSPLLEEIIQPNQTVLFVVPDATRASASGEIINLLTRRLIANGTMPYDIACIFATGIHRRVTEEEKKQILTPFIFQRLKNFDHNPRDLMQIINLGKTKNGVPIELNRVLKEFDHIILVGGISFHYFAGFGGGRKLICPGLASTKTVNETHKIAFDFEKKKRRDGVEVARLDGNPVHEIFNEITEIISPSFAVNSIVDENENILNIFCGHWKNSHQTACDWYKENFSVNINEKRGLVIVSSGGFPHDINLIQAHKALETASHACHTGGKIIWLAQCNDGIGRKDFLDWFTAKNSSELAEMLEKKYQVNGQTGWSLMEKLEKFDVTLITDLPKNETNLMRLKTTGNLNEALKNIDLTQKGYILPFGAKFHPNLQ